MRRIAVVITILLIGGVLPATVAGATHPGQNGPIVLDATDSGGIAVVGLDGSVTEILDRSAIHLEVSPDGRTALFVGVEPADIQVVSLAGGPANPVIPRERGGRPDVSWSPDGSRFIVADGRTVTSYNVQGLDPQVLYDVQADPNESNGFDAAVWTSANEIVAVNSFGGVRIDVATRQVVNLDIDTSTFGVDDQFGLDSSPDGQQLVISCGLRGEASLLGICILDRDLNLVRNIPQTTVAGATRIMKPAWSPDGTRLAYIALFAGDVARVYTSAVDGTDPQLVADLPADDRFQGNFPGLSSWAPVPDSPPTPLDPPPPPPTNNVLECGGFDADPGTTERADYTDPVLYAVAVSQARFGCDGSDLANFVVLSRDDTFADSLVGAALTGDGPLLFTQTNSLPPATRAEIDRLLGSSSIGTVYILGGNLAVSDAIEEELDEDYIVSRLAGPSRVETSVEVAELVAGRAAAQRRDVTQVAVARAGGPADNPTAAWADSVSSGAWTAAAGIPIVVTDTAGVHPAVADFLEGRTDLEETILLGGTAALSEAVAAGVTAPRRIAGASRDSTAAAIATDLIGFDTGADDRQLVVINGYRADGWLFGLPAAGLAADAGAAIALAQDPLPPATADLACGPAGVDLLLVGAQGILNQQTAENLDATSRCP